MATIDWPAGRTWTPASMRWGASTPKSAWAAYFTGQVQSISHLADRLRCVVTLPPCGPADAGAREAFFLEVASAGHWVRLGHPQRPTPLGTLRGSPTVASSAAVGARTLSVQGSVGDTLAGGDVLGAGGQLLQAGYAGAVANGSGVLSVPLVLPLRAALSAGAAVTWSAPTATWQLAADAMDIAYGRRAWQQAVEVPLVEVFA